MDKSIKFLKDNLKNDSTLLVGCSGGPDSMCLLYLVNSSRQSMNLKVIVAHINHNIREESLSELEFVSEYCKVNNDIFEEYTIENKDKYNESDYRNFRYDFFRELIKKHDAKYLLTAHHGDDLI